MFFIGTDTFSDGIKKRNYLIAFLAGTITGIAWWIIIDILVRSTEHLFARVYILPGAAITLMLLILHCIPDAAIHDENGIINMFSSSSTLCDCDATKCARFSLFAVFLIIFSAVVASIWIFIADYASTDEIDKQPGYVQWFGAGNMVFTVLLAIAALLSRFGRKESDSMTF
jgi:heme/copper-type cytochrome/quinol oxidase subunit 4